MGFIGCYDVVAEIIDEADKQFGSLWKIDYDKQSSLRDCCEKIDELMYTLDGAYIEIGVDDTTMDISIQLVCESMTIQYKEHVFYDIVQQVKSLGFAAEENNYVRVSFVFEGVWNKTF